jgi:phosphomevalonate kinase
VSGLAASAPGKAFLCGEYAVTEGAQAIVAAVDRRVIAGWVGTGDGHAVGPEASAALAIAREVFGSVPGDPILNRARLFEGSTKLGLGSSAAAAVAVAGAVAAHHGRDPTDAGVRRTVLECALRGHERVAPDGSGADVVAATHGGFVSFRRPRDRSPQVEALRAPPSLVLSLIWTGTAVRTSDLLMEVKQLRASSPSAYERTMSALREGAEELARAFSAGHVGIVIETARAYHEAMSALGRAAGAPIVDARLEEIARAAAAHGGSSKPCGAGGGDVAIAFFDDPEAAGRFERSCAEMGFKPIDVTWGAEGVRVEGP